MFTSELIKKAWRIRREAARKYNCAVSVISWKECLVMAKEKMYEVHGQTFQIKNQIKKYGFEWNKEKKVWQTNSIENVNVLKKYLFNFKSRLNIEIQEK